jgi:hypothetical protein
MEQTQYLITGSSNYGISLKSIQTTFLPPEPKWPIFLAILVETPRYIYAYNTLKTSLTPLSLKKK